MMTNLYSAFLPVFEKRLHRCRCRKWQRSHDKISHNHFDATLIDIRLPDMDGTDILSTIQKTSPDAVKIVYTGSPTVDLTGGLNKGLNTFLVKPVKPAITLEILEDKFKRIAFLAKQSNRTLNLSASKTFKK
jgi:DNA-binding NtrC family response regulator